MTDETSKKVAERFMGKEADWDIYSMSNLRPKSTGVDGVVIWISTGTSEGKKIPHGPRVKITLGDTASSGRGSASISVGAHPRVVAGTLPAKVQKDVLAWVRLNQKALTRYWNDEIETVEVLPLLKKIV